MSTSPPYILILVQKDRKCGRAIIRGILEYARLNGPWDLNYQQPDYVSQSNSKQIILKRLESGKVKGLILDSDEFLQPALKNNIPVIAVDVRDKFAGLVNILGYEKQISKMAFDYLIGCGYQHLAFCGFDNIFWSNNREKYFCQIARKHKKQVFVYRQPFLEQSYSWDAEFNHMAIWVEYLPKPVAIFAANDDRGYNVLEVCKHLRLRVPEDVAVLGVDNDEFVCELTDTPMSSIALDFQKAGFSAASILDRMIRQKRIFAKKSIYIHPTHVVIRKSTDVAAVADPDIAKALVFIRDNAKKLIQVSDVQRACQLSRKTLELRFKKLLGRTVLEEIRRVRVEQIAAALVQTNLPISVIADSFGFGDFGKNLSRYFKQVKGLTPQKYRQLYGQSASTD